MIEVFKTNIPDNKSANKVQLSLSKQYPNAIISIDLSDCDKVLRIEHSKFNKRKTIEIVKSIGFHCEILNY